MKIIIAGSRQFHFLGPDNIKMIMSHAAVTELVEEALSETCMSLLASEIVSGQAAGVDAAGMTWATKNQIPIKTFRANWEKYGKPAGIYRNLEMANYADALVAIWDGHSTGTKHMIDTMYKQKKTVYVFVLNEMAHLKPLERKQNYPDPAILDQLFE